MRDKTKGKNPAQNSRQAAPADAMGSMEEHLLQALSGAALNPAERKERDRYLACRSELLAFFRELTGTQPLFLKKVRLIGQALSYEHDHRVSDGVMAQLEAAIRGELSTSGRPARMALISDIHGNLPGLKAVLADLEAAGCDAVYALGDHVDGGEHNDGVIETLSHKRIACCVGGHDRVQRLVIKEQNRAFLDALAPIRAVDDALLCHVTPLKRDPRSIAHPREAARVFKETSCRLLFVGGTHIPHLFAEGGMGGSGWPEVESIPFEPDVPVALDSARRYIISVGAVGYGRHGWDRNVYAIYDWAENTIEFRAVAGPMLNNPRVEAMIAQEEMEAARLGQWS